MHMIASFHFTFPHGTSMHSRGVVRRHMGGDEAHRWTEAKETISVKPEAEKEHTHVTQIGNANFTVMELTSALRLNRLFLKFASITSNKSL